MPVRAWIALTTLCAFVVTMVWPSGAVAEEPAPPPPPQAQPAPPAAPAATPPADGDEVTRQAKQHFESGRNAFNAGDYITAIREFKAAEALRESPILLFNIGIANERLGKKRVALKYYQRYLEKQPNAQNRADVDASIQRLQQAIAAEPPPATTAQPGGSAPQPTMEQPGDMPPPDSGQPTAAQAGYDPYASQPPPAAPVMAKKKRSLWWIWLIVGGVVTITVVAVVVAVLLTPSSTVVYDHPQVLPGSAGSRIDRDVINGVTLFHF
jgi:hypothetical protein